MSKTTKLKHVTNEVINDFTIPEPPQEIVQVLAGKGNNLHEVKSGSGDTYLVSMPTKFRRNVWIKRGDYVVIEPIEEGDKVKAEIVRILYKEQIKYLIQMNKWPSNFNTSQDDCSSVELPEDSSDTSSATAGNLTNTNESLFVNTNRPPIKSYVDSDSESDTTETSYDSDEYSCDSNSESLSEVDKGDQKL